MTVMMTTKTMKPPTPAIIPTMNAKFVVSDVSCLVSIIPVLMRQRFSLSAYNVRQNIQNYCAFGNNAVNFTF